MIMPELPEVETVRRVLAPHLQGRTIETVRINNARVIASPEPEIFVSRVAGQVIENLTRRGKFLQIRFVSGGSLTVHLRMTGCLTIEPCGAPCEKHTHLFFTLNDGGELRYEDVRRFGKFWFADKDEPDLSGIDRLGIEPFDASLTAEYLRKKCGNSAKPVKEMLLDQSIVAGIGNIYSDEILFTAKIRPDTPCNRLAREKLECLAKVIPERLAYFIEKNRITFEEYLAGKGKDYRNAVFLQVYGRAGEHCPVCDGILESSKIAGRRSVFCPNCQA